MIPTMQTSGHGRHRIPYQGSVAFAGALLMLLCSLVLAAAARADSPPKLTDEATGSTTTTAVGHTVALTQGSYRADPTGAGIHDSWYDCPTATVSFGCTPITPSSTTPPTYVVESGDQGDQIAVVETDRTRGNNAVQTTSIAVPAAPPAPPPAPTNITPPSITGATTSGSTLTAVPGQWTGSGNSYSYSWSRCSKNSSGLTNCTQQSTAATYQLGSGDVGQYIQLSQTATNGGGSATARSAAFGPITTPAPVGTPPSAGSAVPSVAGAPQVGATLTADPVTMSNNPSYAYQWLRCAGQSCTAIPGATAVTYSPIAADLGDALVFSETATNAGGSGHAQSAKTAIVTAPTETTLQIATSGVVAGQTATLIATVTSATGQAPPMGAVTFEQAGTAIPSCTSIATQPAGASATITCQTAFVGSASTLSAVFTPNPGADVTGSDSAAIGFVLGRAATATTLRLPAHVTVGKRVELTAKVAPQAGTQDVSPTGMVVFLDGKKAIKGCTPTLGDGVARCAVTYQRLGRHSISAEYLGDGNFSGSATHMHKLAVVVAKPTGYVSSLMTWTFRFEPRFTRVSMLTVTGVAPGLQISLGCSGSGCPRHGYVDTITRARCGKHDNCKNVNLAQRFDGRKLGVGAKLTIRLTHRGWLGKYYSFVVRHGRAPKIETACLAVGQTKPGAGCTPR